MKSYWDTLPYEIQDYILYIKYSEHHKNLVIEINHTQSIRKHYYNIVSRDNIRYIDSLDQYPNTNILFNELDIIINNINGYGGCIDTFKEILVDLLITYNKLEKTREKIPELITYYYKMC